MPSRQTRWRTTRDELQEVLGELGEVLPYVQLPIRARGMIATGWYAELRLYDDACNCPRCLAARASAPAFFGSRKIEALEEVAIYKHEHAELVRQAATA
jgi:hypothetical protein